jgi:hypothetical protein
MLEFFPQRGNPGNVNEDFLLGTATKILDEFPAGEVEYPGTPSVLMSSVAKLFSR